ncbi:MAG: ribonuclease III [Pseudomonadota bacterium]|jgi:ribonuclease-3|nr:ribonuclease III [Alphaproteobacteria bacterium]
MIEEILGHTFKKQTVLTQALTPPALQQRKKGKAFERLEFLGDRILGLIIAEALYTHYAHDEEGKLAKRLSYLTSREFCNIVAEHINLAEFLPLKKHELQGTSILANCIEALIAALYIDGGMEAAQRFVHKYWESAIYTLEELPKDPKTLVQEWAQKNGLPIPQYKEIKRSGPDHAPIYILEVSLQNGLKGIGEGKNKKLAEKEAAQALWNQIL